jgi:hypothetical protein
MPDLNQNLERIRALLAAGTLALFVGLIGIYFALAGVLSVAACSAPL